MDTKMNMATGNVVEAGERFARRYFPVDALVQHAEHGKGTVRERNGALRLVAFQRLVSKTLQEIPREEWPDENPLNVRFVKTMEISPRWVVASELKLISLPALDAGEAIQAQGSALDQAEQDSVDLEQALPNWLST